MKLFMNAYQRRSGEIIFGGPRTSQQEADEWALNARAYGVKPAYRVVITPKPLERYKSG